ncbi:MAG: glycosyltransferase [Promethearchaeota archaeon]
MNVLVIYPKGNALNPHSGAETRIWNLISFLVNRNFNVSILHSIKSKGYEDERLKKKCNVYYYKDLSIFGASDWYISDLNPFFIIKLFQIIRKQKIDIIQLEFPWGFLTIKFLAKKNSLLIYDSQGVESEFIKISMMNPKFPKILKPFAKFYAKFYEKIVCKLADVIINVSDIDRNYYIKNYKINRSKTILIQTPSALTINDTLRSENLKLKSRKKLGLPIDKTIVIFHGGLPHPPNQEAFDLIKNFIAPNINNPDIVFVLAGYNVEKFKKNNIISLGFVKELKDFLYSADFAIVPLISGSGMRIKCMDYIITALPFITTKKGIEGIDILKAGEDFLMYDTINNDFLEGIKLLYNDIELRQKLHQNLLKKSNILNREKFENRFYKLYLKLINQNIK